MRHLILLWITLFTTPALAAEEKAIFAGGCFWCMHAEFDGIKGVNGVLSGYTGGHVENPTYEQVSTGTTGHVEAIEVVFDPAQVSYETLLAVFWDNVDPLDDKGQFCDKGSQYLAGIFTFSEDQAKLAKASKAKAEKRYGQKVATSIRPASTFYPAEDYHQDYYLKNEMRYKLYKLGCGRQKRLDALEQQAK